MDYLELRNEVKYLADVVQDNIADGQDFHDALSETVDSHGFVIYYHDAWELVTYARFHDANAYACAEEFVEALDVEGKSMDELMSWMAYGVLYELVREELECLNDEEAA